MIPYAIVLEPGLIIYKIYNGYWYFGRPTLEATQDFAPSLKNAGPTGTSQIPLKAAWQDGRKNRFYPYGKSFIQTLVSTGLGAVSPLGTCCASTNKSRTLTPLRQ